MPQDSTPPRNLHFDEPEFRARQQAVLAEMERAGLDALLLFRQESMYWLTGYDTFGYVHFQAMVLTGDGRLVLLTRSADRLQARFTSRVNDIRIWTDGEHAAPERELRGILAELGLSGRRLGVEWEAYGLTAAKGRRLADALEGFGSLEDASLLVTRLRAVKSPAEIAHVRRAAALADEALAAATAATRPGAYEGDILAELQGAIFRGGGDDPANEQIIGSGPGALMCRYFTGRRTLDPDDLLTLEFAAAWRHYHAALMRTVVIGRLDPRVAAMHAACEEALLAAEAALRPGEPARAVFEAHAAVMEARGQGANKLNACGYSLGTTFAPNWMDWPMFYEGQSYILRPGNTFFIHMILFDEANGLAMTLARTSLVTETGAEPLSQTPLDLIRR
ncbi:MAG: aminopeptidase P family protein [Rhodobacteraceae bacterium]|nr:aminopeptidase P family protein [Paracoccaceae bacterium]